MPALGVLLLFVFVALDSARAQIVINEVLANNERLRTGEFIAPEDLRMGTPDMIEIYNAGDQEIALGEGFRQTSYALSDWYEYVASPFDPHGAWRFPANRATLAPGESLIVFCDGDIIEAECELHATFAIDSDGTEPITLWGPEIDGQREIIDQVWLPPLARNVSFGRFPDGAGPAPVPVAETFDHFVYSVQGTESPPTFQIGVGEGQVGGCRQADQDTNQCVTGVGAEHNRTCSGAPNAAGVFAQAPSVSRDSHTTNRPAAGQPVAITLRVRDDDEPVPGNIARVEIRYRVDGGEPQTATAVYDADTGILPRLDGFDPRVTTQPLDRYTLWTATIPGQAAGAFVEFYYYVEDRDGMSSTSPGRLCDLEYEDRPEGEPNPVCPDCPDGCDREFGGTNCVRDSADITCIPSEGGNGGAGDCVSGGAENVVGKRYHACDARYSYVSGFTPSRPELANLVVNEVVVSQNGILADPSEDDCGCDRTLPPELGGDCLDPDDPNCCQKLEDFIEIYNASDGVVSLSGVGLTDAFFEPKKWRFPDGATIAPGARLIVWVDNDGAKCPDPGAANPPCFWECPDPTAPASGSYHTSFALDLGGDQIYIVDASANWGIVHGTAWRGGDLSQNQSLALLPDGDPAGCFFVRDRGAVTPGAPNGELADGEKCGGDAPMFKRGDASNSCGIDLSDAVYTLNWLFLGGMAPACPDAADTNDSGGIDLSDAVAVLNWLFIGGAEPPAPGPYIAGPDPTDDTLGPCEPMPCAP